VAGHPRYAELLDFDDGNESELAGHQITPMDVYQLLENDPVWVPNKKKRAGVWLAVGFTDGGRALTVAVRLRRQSKADPSDHRLELHRRRANEIPVRDAEMDEKKLADELQASKDDPADWGDPDPGVSTATSAKRRLAAMVSVRLTPEELRLIQARAADRGESVSAYLRNLAVRNTASETSASAMAVGLVSISTGVTYLPRLTDTRNTVDGSRLWTSAGAPNRVAADS
jgi:uncharacterized DUF497 family protein